MFQTRNWNKGVIQRQGRDLKIAVSRPPDLGNGIVLMTIALFMAWGFCEIFLSDLMHVRSPADFLWRAIPVPVFGVPFFLLFRWLFEREFADQIVVVAGGEITWVKKTRWWSRKRSLSTSKVVDISASQGWSGLGRVDLTIKRHRYAILEQLLNEDAVQFARALNEVMNR